MSHMTVREYRNSLGLSLEQFAAVFEKSKGYFSAIENDNACPPDLALKIEDHSKGLVNAADLNDVIATARKTAA